MLFSKKKLTLEEAEKSGEIYSQRLQAGYAFGMRMHEDMIDRIAEENRRLRALNEMLRKNNDSLARQVEELKKGEDSSHGSGGRRGTYERKRNAGESKKSPQGSGPDTTGDCR